MISFLLGYAQFIGGCAAVFLPFVALYNVCFTGKLNATRSDYRG